MRRALKSGVFWLMVFAVVACEAGPPWQSEPERPLWGSGTIEGTSVTVSARVGGMVEALHVSEGERVDRDALLLSLDGDDLESERDMRRLDVRIAETQLELLDVGAREEDIRQAESRLRRAERERESRCDDYERIARLFDGGSVTRSRYDEAELALDRAETEYESARQELQRLRTLTRPEEREIAGLEAEQAAIGLELAARQLDRAEVKAPLSARVELLYVEAGELVQPGQSVARLVERAPARLTVYVPQRSLSQVDVDDRAEVLVDAYPQERFEGRVTRIADEAEFTPSDVQTRDDRARLVFAVEVELANEDGRLRPGMAAEAEFPDAERQGE